MADGIDVIVIGAGPGGYVAAIRAAQLGMTVACIDKRTAPGGTCLNIGCIPSKALLQSSERFAAARHDLANHGVKVTGVTLDLKAMLARKDKVVTDNTRGVEFLFRKNKVEYIKGTARLVARNRVAVDLNDGGQCEFAPKKAIILATGSDSASLPGVAVDEKRIVSSTGALVLDAVPRRLAVVGGGYIGLEMGSVWNRLGSEVTVIEFLDRITPNMDGELSMALQHSLEKQGITFRLGTKVVTASTERDGVSLALEQAKSGVREDFKADVALIATGRVPYIAGLGLEEVGIALDDQGRIKVDECFATNITGVYAVGDVIAGPMLAHKASEEGVALIEMLAGRRPTINYNAIPAVIYTRPEIASVGQTEEQMTRASVTYKTGKFPFSASARARANGFTEGFVKILADRKTDRVLGVHIIGPDAGTIIAEAALALEFVASAEDIARTVHAHPTLEEAVKEAALAVDGYAIHI